MSESSLAIAEVIPEPVLLLSGSGIVLGSNKRGAALLKCASRRGDQALDPKGLHLQDFLVDPPPQLNHFMKRCCSVRAPMPGALTFRCESSESKRYRISGLLLEPPTSSMPGVICLRCSPKNSPHNSFMALTEKVKQLTTEVDLRMRAEHALKIYQRELKNTVDQRTRQLQEAQAELIDKEKLAVLGQLTAIVSHELRNPLGTIGTAIFSIGDAVERQEYGRLPRSVTLAQRNVARCNRIITDMLDFTSKKAPRLEETDLDRWLETVISEQELPDGLDLSSHLMSGATVSIDRDHLHRVVVNVITNATQALERCTDRIAALCVRSSMREGLAVITIKDNGSGIDSETLERVFQPLFSTKGFGVGLGLPIVKDIMDAHDGSVEIDSVEGSHTIVSLLLPHSNKP